MVGKIISHYQILEKIGEGGMGVVYEARDTHLDRFVAIKVLPPEKVADPERKRRFVQEAKAASALSHPNIITVHDIDQANGVDFIAMELVEGKTLDELIGLKGLRLNEALKYGVQIADALAAAHAVGIIHRDLKPGNVMVTDKGHVKVLDFGLAKLTQVGLPGEGESTRTVRPTTEEGTIVGTVAYMSPEQVRGQAVDHRSDIFNLGLVLYEMLAGKRAFTGQSSIDVMSAILKEPPPELPESVPAGLRDIVLNCLEKDAANRFESARDLAFALRALSTGSGISAAALKIEAPPKKRRWALPAVAAACLVLAVALAARVLMEDDHSVNLANYKLMPFATDLTTHNWPAWSPDGRSIAYAGVVEGSSQLFVQSLDSPTSDQITKPPLIGGRPFWSPDSREVYFTTSGSLRRVSAGGGEPAQVQPNALTGSLSPDGRTLVFLRVTQSPRSFGVWIASPPEAEPKPYEPAPFKATTYTNTPSIRFAPDGRKILVAANLDGQGEQVWMLPWPPAQSRRISSALPLFGGTPVFSWLPDSRHVLLSATTDPSTPSRLLMGDVDTDRFWPVLADTRSAGQPSVSPDGTKAIYTSNLGHFDVVEVPLDGGPVRTLLGSLQSEIMPSFSPVGRTLVYVTNRRGGYEVWMDGLAEQRTWPLLTASDFRLPAGLPYWFMTPAFSPDGQRVAVVAVSNAGARLWIAGVAGSPPVRITTEEETEWAPTWSPDGLWIAHVTSPMQGQRKIAKVRVGTSQPPIDLVQGPSIASLPEWSPTGEWIACTITDKPGITLVSPDGKNTRLLPGVSAPHAWSRDGKTIYQVRGTTNCSLWAIDIATGKERVIRELGDLQPASPLGPGLRITVAPDGKSLAWAVNRARSELWILEGLRTPRPWYARMAGLR